MPARALCSERCVRRSSRGLIVSLPQLVIVCGGENSRLRTLQGSIYKPFLDLQGSTIVAKYIERARREGIERVAVVTDEVDGLVSRLIAEIRSVEPGILVEELTIPGDVPTKIVTSIDRLGLAGQRVFVALGDTFVWYSFRDLAELCEASATDSALVVGEEVSRFGVLQMDSELVVNFDEKPRSSQLINLGQMLLGARAVEMLSAGASLQDALSALASSKQLAGLVGNSREYLMLDSIADVVSADERVRSRGWEPAQ